MIDGTLEKLVSFIESKGLRMTNQRRAIVEAAFSTTEHFTAEQLLDMARKRDSSASRATVYRTLPLLVESGLLKELDFGRDCKYYDPNYIEHPRHNHIICQDCDRIIEFDDEKLDQIEDEVAQKLGFKILGQNLQLRGSCQKLKNTGSCDRKTEHS